MVKTRKDSRGYDCVMEKIFLRKGGCMSNTLDATKKGSYRDCFYRCFYLRFKCETRHY